MKSYLIRETHSFNPFFSLFYIGDGWIASSMAVYHQTTPPYFAPRLYWSTVTLLILDTLPDETAELW